MGAGLLNSLKFYRKWSEKETSVTILGLDSAGKTTILNKLKYGFSCSSIPTIGYNVEVVKIDGISFTVWDLGGQEKLRSLWGTYTEFTAGIVFVIDYIDYGRLDVAATELHTMLSMEKNSNKPLLILANKIDDPLPENKWRVVEEDLLDKLRLRGRSREKCRIWQVSAEKAGDKDTDSDQRLRDSLKWLGAALTAPKS